MLLNVKQIVEKFLITNGKGKEAQVGYDLTIERITQISNGIILKDESKIMPYKEVESDVYMIEPDKEKECWILAPGVYSLTFEQGIKLDTKHTAFIIHRSSILRAGCFITSGVFDPGFECDKIGATLFVVSPITIEKGARIAQILIHENYESEAYDGQFQGDKDRK